MTDCLGCGVCDDCVALSIAYAESMENAEPRKTSFKPKWPVDTGENIELDCNGTIPPPDDTADSRKKARLIYLASPYSHDDPAVREDRFIKACVVAAVLFKQGDMFFSPIAHSHPIALVGCMPTDWKFWEEYDRKFIGLCTEMYVLTLEGWRQSKGVAAEIMLARAAKKKVTYIKGVQAGKIWADESDICPHCDGQGTLCAQCGFPNCVVKKDSVPCPSCQE